MNEVIDYAHWPTMNKGARNLCELKSQPILQTIVCNLLTGTRANMYPFTLMGGLGSDLWASEALLTSALPGLHLADAAQFLEPCP
jgi:hypothetical protein